LFQGCVQLYENAAAMANNRPSQPFILPYSFLRLE